MNDKLVKQERAQGSLIERIARRYHIDPGMFYQTLKATIGGDKLSDAQMAAFLMVAEKYDLNPFTKEIYGAPDKTGGILPIVSVDGWATIVNRDQRFDGVEFEYDFSEGNSEIASVTCRIFRKDLAHPVEVTEFLDECYRNTPAWKWKRRMLRHKAFIQAARIAFGLCGIYDPDEAERILEAEGASIAGETQTPMANNAARQAILAAARVRANKARREAEPPIELPDDIDNDAGDAFDVESEEAA